MPGILTSMERGISLYQIWLEDQKHFLIHVRWLGGLMLIWGFMKDVWFHILLVVLLKMCNMSPSSQIPLHYFGYLWLFDKGKKINMILIKIHFHSCWERVREMKLMPARDLSVPIGKKTFGFYLIIWVFQKGGELVPHLYHGQYVG